MTNLCIEGSTYQVTAVRHDRTWGHGLDVHLSDRDGSRLGSIFFVIHPEFDDYESYQAKSTEQLLAIVTERLEAIVIANKDSLAQLGHIIVALNSPQMTS